MNDESPSEIAAPAPAMTRPTGGLAAEIAREVARRRTFAIISHPDAGKTTLTEKLLLFGGAIQLAGQVRAKRRPAAHALGLDGDRARRAASRSSPR